MEARNDGTRLRSSLFPWLWFTGFIFESRRQNTDLSRYLRASRSTLPIVERATSLQPSTTKEQRVMGSEQSTSGGSHRRVFQPAGFIRRYIYLLESETVSWYSAPCARQRDFERPEKTGGQLRVR